MIVSQGTDVSLVNGQWLYPNGTPAPPPPSGTATSTEQGAAGAPFRAAYVPFDQQSQQGQQSFRNSNPSSQRRRQNQTLPSFNDMYGSMLNSNTQMYGNTWAQAFPPGSVSPLSPIYGGGGVGNSTMGQ